MDAVDKKNAKKPQFVLHDSQIEGDDKDDSDGTLEDLRNEEGFSNEVEEVVLVETVTTMPQWMRRP